ncbi:aryl-alcohol dehydrogenase-like predicted oxidoreductase [Motilibacter peucedani]|uniref:Aryl-alcohol dehydrogenase-like predicted oxidoreductase n=1 Tax=Motilibacter peucedani TaxID=598650 RepID=A0A420XQU4_9ACTN|nr:aldo/keto reductase [Motilibacter peucedani]RKS75663.1 aryl-alcohol dehydrogenase-like predicted oxidoreductase [Motilibacter peucedani]
MHYRQLGRSGLRVSALSLGTMTFGGTGWASPLGGTGVEDARRQVEMCIEAGVNLFDTADVYSTGLSEQILGEALGAHRDDVLVATKVRMGGMGPGANDAGSSRHHIVRGCEASLRRLGTDWIDLYQLHEWDGQTPLEETLAALEHLVQSGKVRYVGASNYTGWQLMKALAVADSARWSRFASHQIHYTLQARDAEYELLPASVDQGVGVLVWSPLAGGLLSGKYRRDEAAPEGTRRFAGWDEPPVRDEDQLYAIVDVLLEVAEAHGVSAAQVSLAWLLTRPAVSSVIVGARTDEQLADNLRAAELVLTDDELDRLEQVSRPPLIYPHWHQAATSTDRLGPADLALLRPFLQR